MPNHTFKNNTLYSLPSGKVLFCILLSVFSTLAFSKQISFDFSSEHGNLLLGHKTNEFRQYIDTNGGVKLTVTPKSTSSPHLQQCHKYNEPNDIYVHQDFSGLGVKYRPKHFWMPPFRDSGELDTYSGYTDRLSFEFSSAITGELVPVTVKNIRFKRFEPLLFWDNAYIQDANSGDVINVSKHSIHKNLFRELFPTSFMERHTFGFWRFDTSLETNSFVITPGKFDSFKVYSITIEIGEQAPKVISTPPVNAIEGQKYEYQVVTASKDDYTYSLIQAPDGMAIDDSTGTVVWTPTFAQSGIHPVELTVTDKQGRLTNQTYNLSVENNNRAPVISSSAIKITQENSLYLYSVVAADPDEDSLSFKLTSAPVGMVISAQGTISWQPTFDQAGDHEILVSVSDGSLMVSQAYSLAVENVNQLPILESIPAHSIKEADEYQYEVQASDSDGDLLHYALHSAPTGMFINSEGKITWLPNYQQAGSYAITVNVSDGDAMVQAEYVLIVENVNRSPVITSQPIISAVENASYAYPIKAFDADGDSLNFELQLSPTGMAMTADGTISWTPNFNQFGDHPVTVRVNDASSYIEHAFVVSVSNTNRAPAISSQPTLLASENASYQYAVSATDEDLDKITYKLVTFAVGMSISPSGVVSWLPTYDQEGTHAVLLQVSDGKATDTQAFDIEVVNTNRVPVISSIAILSGEENDAYLYQVLANDLDSDVLIFQLETAPQGMTITPSGLIQWLPSYEKAGQHLVEVSVSDALDTTKQVFTIEVTNVNRSPKIISLAILTAKENVNYSYNFLADDADSDSLSYQLVQAPTGMNIGQTGLVSWTPSFNQEGLHAVEILVTDGIVDVKQNYSIEVDNSNRAPLISSLANSTAQENVPYSYQLLATDPDGEVLTYSLITAPAGMTVNTKGRITWQPSYEQAAAHSVLVRVADQITYAEQGYVIHVENTNRAPVVSDITDVSIYENNNFKLQLNAIDPDGDALIFDLQTTIAGMTLSDSGLLSWTPTFDQDGEHVVSITVTDATLIVTRSFVINVVNTNRAPVVTSTPNQSAIENGLYHYQVVSTDADLDTLNYQLTAAPQGMIISESGLIDWTPNYFQSGEHAIALTIDDGMNTITHSYVLNVSNSNRAPTFTSVPLTEIQEKDIFEYTAVASDLDADALKYAIVIGPQDLMIDANSGVITWQTQASDIGSHYIVISATDTSFTQVEQGFALAVLNVNDAPVIKSAPILVGAENQAYTYQIIAKDEDGDTLNFSLTSVITGMTLNTQTGLMSWLPNFQQAGDHLVNIQVSDGQGSQVDHSFTLAVANTNRVPQISSQPELELEVGEVFQYQVQASDLDSDVLFYELINAPSGMIVNSTTGLMRWIATELNVGENSIELSVNDGIEATTQAFTLTVLQPEVPIPLTHMGTEYWFTFNPNVISSKEPEKDQRTVTIWSQHETDVRLSSEFLDEDVIVNLAKNTAHTFDLTEYKNVFDRIESGISNDAFYIKSSFPIVAILNNKAYATQDSTLLYPLHALGKEYLTFSYGIAGSYSSGAGFKAIAAYDDTEITLKFTQDVTWDNEIKSHDIPFTVSLNSGQTLQINASGGAWERDLMGSYIQSTKPVSVFTGRKCTTIQKFACDHLVEQLLPINSVSSRYISVPLATRKKGDTIRVMAAKNNSIIKINEGDLHVLDRGEFVEKLIDGVGVYESNNPIYVIQYSNGADFDANERETDSAMADPFMLSLPPVEAYLDDYLIITPSDDIALNFVNLIAPVGAIVTHNDMSLEAEEWTLVEGTKFQYLQYAIEQGAHHFKGNMNFGAYQYGYDYYVSYGNQAGMRFRDQRVANTLVVSFDRLSQDIGEKVCAKATVQDEEGFGIPVVPVTFNNEIYTMANKTLLTNEAGEVNYCFTNLLSGSQSVEVITEQNLSETVYISWDEVQVAEETKPKFVNFPGEHGGDPSENYLFDFDLDAIDLDGGEVNFTLLGNAAYGLMLDKVTGHITMEVPTCFDAIPVTVQVTDDERESAIMNFSIHRPKGTLRIPQMISEPADVSTPVGIRYRFQIGARCFDIYSVPINLVSKPEGLSSYFAWKQLQVDWTPQLGQEGSHEVIYEVNDGLGGVLNKSFNITVTPNQSPIISSNPIVNIFATESYKYTLVSTDPDGHSLINTLLQAPEGAEFNGTKFTWRPGLNQIGTHTISFEVDDGFGGKVTQTFQLNVLENKEPLVELIPDALVMFGKTYNLNLSSIQDPDGHNVSYALVAGPEGMTFKQSSSDITWTPEEHQIGIHRVLVKAQDELGAVNLLPFYISVLENNAPSIISEDRYYLIKETDFRVVIAAADIDGDLNSLTLESGPAGVYSYSVSSQQLGIRWSRVTSQLGEYTVRVKAEDSIGGVSYKDIIFEVVDESFLFDPNQSEFSLESNLTWSHTISTQGGPVTMSLLQGPVGLTFSNSSKSMHWKPDSNQVGEHNVQIQAEDAFGNIKILDIKLVVLSENLAPKIIQIENQTVYHETLWQMDLTARDPEGDSFTYNIEDGPKNLYIDPLNQQLNWIPTQLQIGDHTVVISVTDEGNHSSRVQFDLNVQARANNAPVFVSTPVVKAILVAPYDYAIEISDADGDGTAIELVRGPRGMQLNGNQIWWQAEASQLGAHEVQIKVRDGLAETYQTFTINVVDENFAPNVSLLSPIDSVVITKPTAIRAMVNDINIKSWVIYIKEASASTEKWRVLSEGDETIEGEVAIIDPTLMVNGLYDILLKATDTRDLVSQTSASVIVKGDLKVGNFSFTVTDLEIPLAGIPIRINRTYDSRRQHEDLDFGKGWSLSMNDIKLEESRTPGSHWALNSYRTGPGNVIKTYCIEPLLPVPIVTVTLPSGEVEEFEIQASPRCNAGEPLLSVSLVFVATNDTDSTLEAVDMSSGWLVNDSVMNDDLSTIMDPNKYKLTTKQGYTYHINQFEGATKIEDPNGQFITYTDDAITHSSGKSISINRYQGSDRIYSIIDPSGNENKYNYASGLDFSLLDSHTDPLGNRTHYIYTQSPFLLTEIIDPLKRKLIKNIYDENNRLIGQEDADGNVKTFQHDINAGTSLITNLDGRTTLFNYDDKGNVTQDIKIISDGSYDSDIVTTLKYDDQDNQTHKTIGSVEYTWVSSFDDDGNQLTATDPEGNAVEYNDYNARGQEGSIVDEMGRKTRMTYDATGNLKQINMPVLIDLDTGSEQSLFAKNIINSRGQITQTTDLRGLLTLSTFYPESHESAGQKHTESNSVSGTTTYTYDANNNIKTESRERTVLNEVSTETVSFDYDKRNRLIKTTYPDTSFTQSDYDLTGNVDKERDRFGAWTDYDYDTYGRLLKTTYTDGTFESRTYTAEGLLKTVTDVSNHTTSYEYDDAERLYKTTNPDASFSETRYTPQGWVKSEKDARGNVTDYEYDLAGKRMAVIRHLGEEQLRHTFTYYKNGELKTETDSNGHTTTYGINEFDQRIQTSFHNNTVSGQRYDAMGARTKQIDQNNRSTQYGYDLIGRLATVQAQVQINNEDVPATTYGYDEVGNKLTQTDAKGRTTSWSYDYFGRILSRTLPEGMSEGFVYDDASRSVIHTDFNGDVTTTITDAMGRAQSTHYSDGIAETYAYWPNGQLQTTTVSQEGEEDQVTRYSYDNRDRLKTETQSDGTVLTYEYDVNGNRTQVKVSINTTDTATNYTYDDLNRLKTVIDDSGTTAYSYDNVGNQKTVSYSNGLITEYFYNEVNQLTNLVTKNASGEIITSYGYELDNTGRRENITEESGLYTDYRYDNLYRLTDEIIKQSTDAVIEDYTANYQYDWVGNRTYETVDGVSTAYSYDLNDRLTSQGGTTYSYDNNGNTLTETLDSTVKTYSYDAKNKLIGVSTTESDVEVSSSAYSYNVNGIRNSKTEGGVTTSYIVDSNRDYSQVLEEIVNGTTTVQYSYGHDLLSQSRSDEFKFYLYDGLGSTRGLSNSAGVLTDSYDYEAFGEVLNEMGDTDNNYKFTGEQFDSSLDQYYLRARYYDQGVGRFTQQDTYMGNNFDPVSLHKYLYANAAPSMYTDPTGNFSIGGMMSTLNVMSTLASTAQTTYSVFQIATGEEDAPTAKEIGSAILFNMLGGSAGKVLGMFSKKIAKQAKKSGCNSGANKNTVCNSKGEAVPGRVQSRINVARCTKNNPKSGICEAGMDHIRLEHFSGKSNKSQFMISEESLGYLLQSQIVVSAPATAIGAGRFKRQVNLGWSVGNNSGKRGGAGNNWLTVYSDEFGNVITAHPGK